MKGAAAMHYDDDDDHPPEEVLSYQSRQRDLDEIYSREYREWMASLGPEERSKLKQLGLDKAYLPSGSGGATMDVAESSLARCEDSHEQLDAGTPTNDEAHEPSIDGESQHDLLRRLVGEMLGQSNASLSLECLALVTGLAYDGDSMTEIARRHEVTRAAVSKRCVELTQALNLKPSRAMRSLLARESYRKARMNHLNAHP
jgi:hypothetical protein